MATYLVEIKIETAEAERASHAPAEDALRAAFEYKLTRASLYPPNQRFDWKSAVVGTITDITEKNTKG